MIDKLPSCSGCHMSLSPVRFNEVPGKDIIESFVNEGYQGFSLDGWFLCTECASFIHLPQFSKVWSEKLA